MTAVECNLLGCPVTDYATGRVIGRVRAVVLAPPSEGGARVAVECPAEPVWAADPGEPEPPVEPRPQQDYMVGQRSKVTLATPEGGSIVQAGEPITPQVIDHARRWGLLHQLDAFFEG